MSPNRCAMVKSGYIGDGHPTFNRNPYNGYINPYWVDDHPLLYGNNGSLDPGTDGISNLSYWFQRFFKGTCRAFLQFLSTDWRLSRNRSIDFYGVCFNCKLGLHSTDAPILAGFSLQGFILLRGWGWSCLGLYMLPCLVLDTYMYIYIYTYIYIHTTWFLIHIMDVYMYFFS